MTRAFIIAATRTPIGRAGGFLHRVSEHQLVAPLIARVLTDAGLNPGDVDEVVMGNAAGSGGNLARVCALAAGLPDDTPATTLDQQCSSALAAIDYAAAQVALGRANCVVAGGTESVSTAPWRLSRPDDKTAMPRVYNRARFTPVPMKDPDMGVAAENVARECGITRQAQDRFAAQSHARACAAQGSGVFDDEITPVSTPDGVVSRDECPRPDLTVERLARLRPAFVAGGTVTAGNSCPINDGASVVLVVGEGLLQTIVGDDAPAAWAAGSPIGGFNTPSMLLGGAPPGVRAQYGSAHVLASRQPGQGPKHPVSVVEPGASHDDPPTATGLTFALEYLDHAVGAVNPELLGLAGVPACQRLMSRHTELDLDDVAVIEFNEAFASQALASLNALGIDPARVNANGGALALGHPYGASGAILMTRIFHQLKSQPDAYALAIMAAAGGVGAATLVKATSLRVR